MDGGRLGECYPPQPPVCLKVVRRRRWDEGAAGEKGLRPFSPEGVCAARVDGMQTRSRILAEEVADQHWLLTLWALTAEPYGSREQVARWTSSLTHGTLATTWTFVHGTECQSPLSLQAPAQIRLLRYRSCSEAQSIAELFVSRRTELCT